MTHTIYRKNDNSVEWTWLKDATSDEYVNDGTVTFTLYHTYSLAAATGVASGTSVHGPVTMSYVTGSNGKYQGKLPYTVALDLSKEYTIEINATANGHTARRSIPVTVVDRLS